MISRYEVVIIGGGMVGLTLACALGQAGRKVAVVEAQAPAPWQAGGDYDLRVVAVNRASQNVLRHLGAWPGIEAMRLSPYENMFVWDSDGAGEIAFSAADLGEPDLGHIVENRVIQLALLEQLESLSSVDWVCPAKVERFVNDEKEAIVTLDDGRLLMTQLVVGADGANSFVRDMAEIGLTQKNYGQQGIVAAVTPELPHAYTAWQRFQPDGVLALLPMSDGRCSIVWSADDSRAEMLLAMDDEAFCAELSQAFDYKLGDILGTSERVGFPLRGRHAAEYVKPRVALVGDAAHTVHPLAGQGVNLGFMDAAALAEVLAEAKRDLGGYALLRKYERARAGENLLMQRLMEAFKVTYGHQQPAVKWLRNTGMGMVHQAPPLKNFMMSYALGTAGDKPLLARALFQD
ncbi:MAG: UbiH/UbiF/VisC/COQ6 family ubiquinone biosynthesis hydroxylase [bacterium]